MKRHRSAVPRLRSITAQLRPSPFLLSPSCAPALFCCRPVAPQPFFAVVQLRPSPFLQSSSRASALFCCRPVACLPSSVSDWLVSPQDCLSLGRRSACFHLRRAGERERCRESARRLASCLSNALLVKCVHPAAISARELSG